MQREMGNGDFRIVTANNRHFYTLIDKKKNYRHLSHILSRDYDIPEYSFILFYNGRCLSYYKRNKFVDLPLTGEPDGAIEICIATKFSKYAELMRTHNMRDLNAPWLYPVIVTSSFGVKIREEFSLHQNTLVKHIFKRICKEYSIPIELQELYHKGRRLENDEFLADLFFTQIDFSSKVKLLLNFTILTHKQVEMFNQRYYKAIKQITLESLTGEALIDFEKENIWSVYNLKDFIKNTRRIPIKQQRILHQGTILNDREMLYDRFKLENDSNDTGNMTITLVIEPCFMNVKFTSDYLEIVEILPSMQFSTMTTIKEMRDRIAGLTDLSLERFAVIPADDRAHMHSLGIKYHDEFMLGEITSLHDSIIKVVRTITIDFVGENSFEYLIREKEETIKQLRKQLEVGLGYRQREYKLVLKSKLNNNIRLLHVPDDEVVTFEAKANESCVLL